MVPAQQRFQRCSPWDANELEAPRPRRLQRQYRDPVRFHAGLQPVQRQQHPQAQGAGGFGRIGAQRLVIYETDGMSNVNTNPAGGFANQGNNQSYYHILTGDTINSAGYTSDAVLQVVQAICNKADGTPGNPPGYAGNPGYPGYSTTRKPVQVQTVVFGAIFEPTAAGSDQSNAVALLQQVAQIGGTRFPSSASDPTDGYRWCIGTLQERIAKLQTAFTNMTQGGISVSLIK